jgi:tetratricopeptide (TPR) repeat protein
MRQKARILQRHSEYYLNIAQTRSHDYEILDIEFIQIKSCMAWLAQQQTIESDQHLVELIKALSEYLQARTMHSDLLNWSQIGLVACERIHINPGWLRLLEFRAYYAIGDWGNASRVIHEAVRVTADSSPTEYAETLLTLGTFQLNRGNYRDALKVLTDAERRFNSLNDLAHVADVKAEIAAYHLNRGNLQKARHLYHEVDNLRRFVDPDNPSRYGHSLLMLGVVYRKLGDYEKSAQYLHRLIETAKVERRIPGIAAAMHHLAWVEIDQGNLANAKIVGGKARELYEQIKDIRGLADADEQLGLIEMRMGRLGRAGVHLSRSLSIRRELGNQHGVASTLRRLAKLQFKQGNIVQFIVYMSK